MLRRLPREEYTVGWVCALPVELAAAAEMLDDEHDTPPRDARHAHDTNTYTCGNIGEHNVVIACLPHGRTGTNSAAAVASQMQTAFTSIRFGLMIGIGGGVPSEDTDIRLGDVVVGTPHRTHGGVIQYDLGKVIPTGFERTGFLNAPPNFLLTAITTLQARLMRGKAIMPKYVCRFKTLTGFERHLASPDMLFHQGYSHHGGKSCSDCDKAYLVNRKMRLQEVVVHYGTIASGNQVIRSATERDRLSDQLGGVLCFEMEAAGLVNSFPCLVVRGICDYADSHKNDDWQTYAAATAAAYTKELLSVVPVADAISTGRTGEAINDRDGRILQSSSSTSSVSAYVTTSNSRGSDHSTIKQRIAKPASNRPQKQDQGKLDDDQKKTLMISLSFAQMDARQMTISTAHTETCTWLLETIQYRNWMDTTKMREHHGFLWLKGNAGTGKSTLMKFAWANVRSTMPDHIILSYFFNARGEDMEKSTTGTYQSLLLQLLERLPALQDVFNSLGISTSNINPSRQWDIESLKSMLQLAIKKLGSSSVVCFIDALDECEEAQIRDMVHFLERTSDMAMAGNINFRVCLSSRHYPHITMRHALELVLEQQYGHTQDIASYVKTELRIGSSSIAQQIRVELQEKASGIFLWVVLVVSILNKESDRGQVHALQQKLKEIPSDLHKLFRDVLTRDTLNKDALVLCIQWVLFAKQPLSPEQLHHAILSGIDPDGMAKIDCGNITEDVTRLFVLDSSKGLAEITVSENPTVQFIHESVRDFLLKTNDLDKILPDFSSNLQGQGNDRLKSCCLNYIKMVVASPSKCLHDRDNDHEDDEDLLYFPVSRVESLGKAARKPMPATQMAPFLEYSILNIFSHADSAEGSGISQADFLKVFPLLQWVKLYNTCLKKDKDRYAESVSLLYVLAEFDMPNLMTALGLIGQCIEVEDERYGCPLLAAVARHSESALRLCLDSIEVRQHCRDPDTAAVARRLIQHDVHHWSHLSHGFNYPNREGFLISAAEIDHEELFELLTISKNLDVDATDSHGRTALWLASGKGWYKAVSSLLDANPATVDVKDVYGEAPLYAATREGYKEVTELLLKRGANANTQGGRYGNALQAASALGHHQIAALLLNNGANINTQGGHYGNALQAASALGHRQLAALLLDNGASIYTQGGFYSDALQAASARGHHRTVALLINKGAIVNAQGGKYGNALQAASAGGHYQTAALLLDNGANINAQGGQHGNAIQAALFKKFAEVTELLLERGAIETPQWSHHPLVRHIRKRIPSSANPAPQPPQTLTNPLQTPVNALPPPTKQPF